MKLPIVCKSKIDRAGNLIAIAALAVADEPVAPKMIAVDGRNWFVRTLGDTEPENVTSPQ